MSTRPLAPATAEAVENLTDRVTERFEATGDAIRALELTIDVWGKKIDALLTLVEAQAVTTTDAAIFAREARERLGALEARIAEVAEGREQAETFQRESRADRAGIRLELRGIRRSMGAFGRRLQVQAVALLAALVLLAALLVWEVRVPRPPDLRQAQQAAPTAPAGVAGGEERTP